MGGRASYTDLQRSDWMSVLLPRPLSPTTMSVRLKPRLTAFRCICSGSVLKPRCGVLRPIVDSVSSACADVKRKDIIIMSNELNFEES